MHLARELTPSTLTWQRRTSAGTGRTDLPPERPAGHIRQDILVTEPLARTDMVQSHVG